MALDLALLALEAGLVDAEGIERARARQRELGGSLDTALLELGLADYPELIRSLARAAGIVPEPEWSLGRVEPEEPIRAAASRAADALATQPIRPHRVEAPPVAEEPPGWSLREATDELSTAQDRDQVLAVVLRYARQFMEAAAVFGVTPHRVAGIDAVGWPGARASCRAIRVAHLEAGLLRNTIDTRGPHLGPLAPEPGNRRLLARMGRSWPAVALGYPVVLRDRVACVLYADNGPSPVSRGIGDLMLLGGAVAAALERVLRASKAARVEPPRPEAGHDGGWSISEPARLAPRDRAAAIRADAFRAIRVCDALVPVPRIR